ncbi:hypothetical protein [Azospirillum canadense]|uniref:hypothetical protein n=1 Tax=Azospirillum canadense TaxID=403962 RepID=UPI002226B4F0|nr:hypothetical protein [Azospirillum canadense]MCW2239255.1 hypothetical protein [Azospirillum canadense]
MGQHNKPSPDVVAAYILAHHANPNSGELTAGDVAEVLGMTLADVFDVVDRDPRVRWFVAGPNSGWNMPAHGGRHDVGSQGPPGRADWEIGDDRRRSRSPALLRRDQSPDRT